MYTFPYVKLYFNHDSDVIFPKKVSLLTKNWPKWSKIAIFVIFWRFFGDNIPNFSKFSKKNVIFSFLTQFYVLKDSIYNYFRKQVFGYLGSTITPTINSSYETNISAIISHKSFNHSIIPAVHLYPVFFNLIYIFSRRK